MFEFKPIRNEQDYSQALDALESIWGNEDQASIDRAEAMAVLIADYERRGGPPLPATSPVDVILARMEDMGLTRKDLQDSIGAKSKVSEVLNGKRQLSLPMMVRLSEQLRVPTDMLIDKRRGGARPSRMASASAPVTPQ
jgi:HTH-type transcriptional regulator / antitoxin HigA